MFISYVTNYQRVSWMLLDGHRCTLSFQKMLANGGIWSWLRHPKKLKHQLINMIAIGMAQVKTYQKSKHVLSFFRSWTPKTSDKWMFIHQNIGPIGFKPYLVAWPPSAEISSQESSHQTQQNADCSWAEAWRLCPTHRLIKHGNWKSNMYTGVGNRPILGILDITS